MLTTSSAALQATLADEEGPPTSSSRTASRCSKSPAPRSADGRRQARAAACSTRSAPSSSPSACSLALSAKHDGQRQTVSPSRAGRGRLLCKRRHPEVARHGSGAAWEPGANSHEQSPSSFKVVVGDQSRCKSSSSGRSPGRALERQARARDSRERTLPSLAR